MSSGTDGYIACLLRVITREANACLPACTCRIRVSLGCGKSRFSGRRPPPSKRAALNLCVCVCVYFDLPTAANPSPARPPAIARSPAMVQSAVVRPVKNAANHGRTIFVYNHIHTKQVVYSLQRTLNVRRSASPKHSPSTLPSASADMPSPSPLSP